MPHPECLDPDVVILEHHSFGDLVSIDAPSFIVRGLEPVDAVVDVGAIGLEDVGSHLRDAIRPVKLERLLPLQHPGREDQVGEPCRVIRMQVCEKRVTQVPDLECRNRAAVARRHCRGASHYARPEIDEVRRIVDHDRHGRTGTARVRVRRAGAQHDHLRCRGRF